MFKIKNAIMQEERQCAVSAGDKLFFDSAVRRQEIAMKDLFLLADRYPGLIPAEALGGLYAINTLLQDQKESFLGRTRQR